MRRAFTLTEVLLVIALIGAVGGVLLVGAGDFYETAARPSVREVSDRAVGRARVLAIERAAKIRLRFDAEAHVLRLRGTGIDEEEPVPSGWTVRFYLPADESLTRDKTLECLEFHPDGGVSPAAIEWVSERATTRYRVEPFSGSVAPDTAEERR